MGSALIYRWLAWLCAALGGLGLILPLLPTTPFVLLAAWAASRGSPRFHRWLHTHPRFGPAIRDWQRTRRVPRRALWWALGTMALSGVLLAVLGMPPAGLGLIGLLFAVIAVFLGMSAAGRLPGARPRNPGRGGKGAEDAGTNRTRYPGLPSTRGRESTGR